MELRSWHGIVAAIAIFAALWETKDHAVPVTKEEWNALFLHWVTPSDKVIEYTAGWHETFQDVVQSASPFVAALCRLVYLTVWPIVWGLCAILTKAANGFYEYIVIRLICSPTTIRNVKGCVQTAIQWQMARSKQEIAMQVAVISVTIAMYLLIRFLNRMRYLDRLKAWMRTRRRKLQMRYQTFLRQVAEANRLLAIMTPHAIFLIAIVLFECLFFSISRWLVENTLLTFALATGKPFVLTVLLVWHLWTEQQQPVRNHRARAGRSNPRRAARRSSILVADNGGQYLQHIDQQELLNQWVVRGTIAAAKQVFYLLPFVTRFLSSQVLLSSLLLKAEFWFWAWVTVVPYITPTFIAEYQTSRGNPIDWLVNHVIEPIAIDLHRGLSLDFAQTKSAWENTVMVGARTFITALAFVSKTTAKRKDTLLHMATESRAVLVPFLLVMIYPLRGFGVLCVSHVLPIAGSLRAEFTPSNESPRMIYHWLQTWVVHTVISSLFGCFAPLLYIIPLSNVLMLGVFAILSLAPPDEIDTFYRSYGQDELRIWHILPPGDLQEKESYIKNFVDWIIEKIPKASDAVPINSPPDQAEMNANDSGGGRQGVLMEANGVAEVPRVSDIQTVQEHPIEKENNYPARNLRKRRATKG